MRSDRIFLSLLLAGLVLLGAGCDLGGLFGSQPSTTGTFAGLSPAEAAARIQFIPGDTFEIRQTLLGLGAFLPDLTNAKDNVRQVTVTRFAPMNVANLEWKIETQREITVEGEQNNDPFLQILTAPGTSETKPEPKTELQTVHVSGSVVNINLKEAHSALLPAYWQEGLMQVESSRSGIWLSDDAYQELSRTKQTPLNLGIFDEQVNGVARNVNELKDALAKLRGQADQDDARGDLTLLKADPEFTTTKIRVNGEEVEVEAIRARNWFGEIVVLNSRQNPMILKVTVNPLFAGAREFLGGGLDSLEELFGYEVANIELKH